MEKKNLTQPKHIINNSTTNITLLSILNDILTYNTDNVTYEEVISFINDTKDNIKKTLFKMFL